MKTLAALKEENLAALRYSCAHRRAIAYVAEKMFASDPDYAQLVERVRYHDLDKMYLYTLVDKKSASAYHKATSPHHTENSREMTRVDMLEAICDWECAAYTKADKTGNAYDAMKRIRPRGANRMFEIMSIYEMNHSYEISDAEEGWNEFLGRYGERAGANDANIQGEIAMFCTERPEEAARIEEAARQINTQGDKGALRSTYEAAKANPKVAAYMAAM